MKWRDAVSPVKILKDTLPGIGASGAKKLADKGIKTVNSVARLTDAAISALSSQLSIPENILRNARYVASGIPVSINPNFLKLRTKIVGISACKAAALYAAGIKNIADLKKLDPASLDYTKLTGITRQQVEQWRSAAILQDVIGVGKVYSKVMSETGINSWQGVISRSPSALRQVFTDYSSRLGINLRIPSIPEIEAWQLQYQSFLMVNSVVSMSALRTGIADSAWATHKDTLNNSLRWFEGKFRGLSGMTAASRQKIKSALLSGKQDIINSLRSRVAATYVDTLNNHYNEWADGFSRNVDNLACSGINVLGYWAGSGALPFGRNISPPSRTLDPQVTLKIFDDVTSTAIAQVNAVYVGPNNTPNTALGSGYTDTNGVLTGNIDLRGNVAFTLSNANYIQKTEVCSIPATGDGPFVYSLLMHNKNIIFIRDPDNQNNPNITVSSSNPSAHKMSDTDYFVILILLIAMCFCAYYLAFVYVGPQLAALFGTGEAAGAGATSSSAIQLGGQMVRIPVVNEQFCQSWIARFVPQNIMGAPAYQPFAPAASSTVINSSATSAAAAGSGSKIIPVFALSVTTGKIAADRIEIHYNQQQQQQP